MPKLVFQLGTAHAQTHVNTDPYPGFKGGAAFASHTLGSPQENLYIALVKVNSAFARHYEKVKGHEAALPVMLPRLSEYEESCYFTSFTSR